MVFCEFFTCAIKYEFIDGKTAIFYGNKHHECEKQYADIAVVVPREERKLIVGKKVGFADECGRFLSFAEAKRDLNMRYAHMYYNDKKEKIVLGASAVEVYNGGIRNVAWIFYPVFGLVEGTMEAMGFVPDEERIREKRRWKYLERAFVTNLGRMVEMNEACRIASNGITKVFSEKNSD